MADMGSHPIYAVPAGTKPSTCRGSSCGARIYWITVGERKIPADCDSRHGGTAPSEAADPAQESLFGGTTAIHDGAGIHHRRVCPNAEDFD